ncbi:hypothetical protein [Actinobacillus equuli]|uniref:hypothetical protein n=1 Tax=Actinobacillus equuli TaxID=718 RepID=UPI00241894B7|nr:hypothetical protein [Actinobacillus equuli]MDG4953518.1 hypothetical protein [Actinobacillus equuli subsp. equuli]
MTTEYQLPKVWQWEAPNGGQFANINRPTSGALFEQHLPKGEHDLQLYSMGTPNGVKNRVYDAAEFLAVHEYPHLMRWAEQIANRPAVIRALAKEYHPIKS